MILVHSTLQPITGDTDLQANTNSLNERIIRYLAYKATCEKHSAEIAAIQKFFPGWLPNPPSK